MQGLAVDKSDDEVELLATPTSSTRTVFVADEKNPANGFFAKLSLRSALLGDRMLHRRTVAGSVGLSGLLEQGRPALPPGIGFFPEVLGLVPRAMPHAGAIIRSIPPEIKDGKLLAAPLFALIGGQDRHLPLLLSMGNAGTAGIREIVEDILLARFARIWVSLVFEHGLILEAHGQNLLLELSPHLRPLGGFYYRDFEGLTADWALRRARHLGETLLPMESEWFPTYETWGYPLYQMVWMKMRTSLFDYFHFVLGEFESAFLEWHARGLIAEWRVREGELTFLFSRYLRRAIQEKFGMREEEYDARHQLNRFVKFLMRVRREIMGSPGRLPSF